MIENVVLNTITKYVIYPSYIGPADMYLFVDRIWTAVASIPYLSVLSGWSQVTSYQHQNSIAAAISNMTRIGYI